MNLQHQTVVPMDRIELSTSPLPRECSTAELHGHRSRSLKQFLWPQPGAGEGNRTLVISLEGFSSTIELHPQNHYLKSDLTPSPQRHLWWREKDSNLRRQSRQIYSLIPLATWVSLQLRTQDSDTWKTCCQIVFRAAQDYRPQVGPAHSSFDTFACSRA